MQTFLLTALTMTAFAANSIVNRAALAGGEIDAASFAAIRLASGAAAITALALIRKSPAQLFVRRRMPGALGLAVYMICFSFAYLSLDAGPGALLLFGVVQVTMFAGAWIRGEAPAPASLAGAVIALSGLGWLLWPSGTAALPASGAALMVFAAIGWAVYSLAGRSASSPLGETASNFVLALPFALLALAFVPLNITATGAGLAILSGAVTSGLGYALWYTVLPRLRTSTAAVAQLSVPIIAAAGSILLLGEGMTMRLAGPGLLVIGGILLAIRAAPRPR